MPLLRRHREQAAAFRAASSGRVVIHPLRVSRVVPAGRDTVAIDLELPDALREAYRHLPGQHVAILHEHAGTVVRRSYSIFSRPGEPTLRIAVKRIAGGAFSPYATEALSVGTELQVLAPSGAFVLAPEPGRRRHYAAIAAGSGITPLLSMLGNALDVEPASRATLLVGNRTRSSIVLADEIEALRERAGTRIEVRHALSGTSEPGCHAGRIDAALLATLPIDEIDEWYACGPAALMELAATTLRGAGVPDERFHRELFHGGDEDPLDRDALPDLESRVTVVLGGERTTLTVPARGPDIVRAAEAVGCALPYACSDGVCATCRARVVAGAVAMDRCSALDARDREAGWVLACQAHPTTTSVVLDFDA